MSSKSCSFGFATNCMHTLPGLTGCPCFCHGLCACLFFYIFPVCASVSLYCNPSILQVIEWWQTLFVNHSPWGGICFVCILANAWMTSQSSSQRKWYAKPLVPTFCIDNPFRSQCGAYAAMNYSLAIHCMSMHACQDLMLTLKYAARISCLHLDCREYKAQS